MNPASTQRTKDLYDVILTLKNKKDLENFFTDLLTPAEIKAMKERWKVCQLLDENNLSYREIHKITGASLTTIVRVARFLKEEQHNGYRAVLDKIKNIDLEPEK